MILFNVIFEADESYPIRSDIYTLSKDGSGYSTGNYGYVLYLQENKYEWNLTDGISSYTCSKESWDNNKVNVFIRNIGYGPESILVYRTEYSDFGVLAALPCDGGINIGTGTITGSVPNGITQSYIYTAGSATGVANFTFILTDLSTPAAQKTLTIYDADCANVLCTLTTPLVVPRVVCGSIAINTSASVNLVVQQVPPFNARGDYSLRVARDAQVGCTNCGTASTSISCTTPCNAGINISGECKLELENGIIYALGTQLVNVTVTSDPCNCLDATNIKINGLPIPALVNDGNSISVEVPLKSTCYFVSRGDPTCVLSMLEMKMVSGKPKMFLRVGKKYIQKPTAKMIW